MNLLIFGLLIEWTLRREDRSWNGSISTYDHPWIEPPTPTEFFRCAPVIFTPYVMDWKNINDSCRGTFHISQINTKQDYWSFSIPNNLIQNPCVNKIIFKTELEILY